MSQRIFIGLMLCASIALSALIWQMYRLDQNVKQLAGGVHAFGDGVTRIERKLDSIETKLDRLNQKLDKR